MELKNKFQDYTQEEFTQLVSEIFGAKGGEAYQDKLLENFIAVSEHPDGSDLIYYNDDPDLTPEKVVSVVMEWRKNNGKPSFKS
ncbi:bacteriocin immunity protein [Cronobacter muytjensii]|nr:bacteriocin immunity protein [Cronobacter muytjensii]